MNPETATPRGSRSLRNGLLALALLEALILIPVIVHLARS